MDEVRDQLLKNIEGIAKENLLTTLRSNNEQKRLPCWQVYRSQSGCIYVCDTNQNTWRAQRLHTDDWDEAIKFLTENEITHYTID